MFKNLVFVLKILDVLDDLFVIEMKKIKEILSVKDNIFLKEYKEFLSEKLIYVKNL